MSSTVRPVSFIPPLTKSAAESSSSPAILRLLAFHHKHKSRRNAQDLVATALPIFEQYVRSFLDEVSTSPTRSMIMRDEVVAEKEIDVAEIVRIIAEDSVLVGGRVDSIEIVVYDRPPWGNSEIDEPERRHAAREQKVAQERRKVQSAGREQGGGGGCCIIL